MMSKGTTFDRSGLLSNLNSVIHSHLCVSHGHLFEKDVIETGVSAKLASMGFGKQVEVPGHWGSNSYVQ